MYDSFAKTFSESRKNHPWPEIDAIIADMKTHNIQKVLDIGCWNGRFLEELDKQWYPLSYYQWIDNSEGMIQEAQKLHPENCFRVCPMEHMETSSIHGGYDAILFLASFHHLNSALNRMQTLSIARNLLAPHGRIYLTNWNLLENTELFERYQDGYDGNGDFRIKIGEYERYYHGFKLNELERLYEGVDYTIEHNQVFSPGKNIFSILTK